MMCHQILALLVAYSSFIFQIEAVPLTSRDLAQDIAVAQQAGDLAVNTTDALVTEISTVDDVLMYQVGILAGNIVLTLHQLGANNSDLQNLQTIINNAEAVTAYRLYLQAYALLAHRDQIVATQSHLDSDLSQISNDRDLIVESQAALDEGFATGLALTTAEIVEFNQEVNRLLEGLSGPGVLEVRASLAAMNAILRDTRDELAALKVNVDDSTAAFVAALDVIIPQLPTKASKRQLQSFAIKSE